MQLIEEKPIAQSDRPSDLSAEPAVQGAESPPRPTTSAGSRRSTAQARAAMDPNWVPAVADIILDLERRSKDNKEVPHPLLSRVWANGVDSFVEAPASARQVRVNSMPRIRPHSARAAHGKSSELLPKFSNAVCSWCGAQDAVLRCARCRSARFCTPACQRASWPKHREACMSTSSLGALKVRRKLRQHSAPAVRAPRRSSTYSEAWYNMAAADTDEEADTFLTKGFNQGKPTEYYDLQAADSPIQKDVSRCVESSGVR